MRRSEETVNDPQKEATEANVEVSADRGSVAVGRDVYDSIIQSFYMEIGDGKIPPELQERLKQKKGVNIPYPRNVNFTGRGTLLDDLRAALQLTHIKALTGLGGVGKTQLALEYSYRYQDDYDIVWWLRSELPSTLLDDYALMATRLKLPGWDAGDLNLMAVSARSFLEAHPRWLLVFDNARNPQDVTPYLPHSSRGQVIITSRNPSWGNLARAMTVSKFERSESVEFLLKRTGEDDRKAADDLAEALGDLPLALEQAGAYIETTAKPLDEYLKSYQKRRLDVLAKGVPSDYPETVATTWDMSFEAVQKDCPAGSELLRLFSYLAPDDIPLTYLVENPDHLPDSVAFVLQDEDERDESLAALRRYSLIGRSGDKISVHRLVQLVTRDNLALREREEWAGSAVKLLNDVFPKDHIDNVQVWPECSDLLPHALAASGYVEELGVELEATRRLLNESGLYLRTLGQFAEAKECFKRAIEIDEKVYGPDHPNVAIDVNNLGSVLRDLGELQEARECFKRAIEIDENVYGKDNPQVAIDVNNLGLMLQDLCELKKARECFERALEIDEKVYGPDHSKVAIRVNNLGGVLQDLCELKKARECFERALKIDEKIYDPDHPNVATTVSNLGRVLKDLGELKKARECFERALEIDEKVYGPDHPSVAIRVNNLGRVLRELGKLQEARAALERALKIDENVYGKDHPNVARDVNNLGSVLRDLGELKEARAALERALKIDENVYGKDHPNVARDINNLGSVLQDLGELKEARAALERALEIFRNRLGGDHPNTVAVRNNLATLERES